MATLVATDVEGSTMLWEWNHAVMDEAIEVHDRIMRAQLFKFGGYNRPAAGMADAVKDAAVLMHAFQHTGTHYVSTCNVRLPSRSTDCDACCCLPP